MNENKNTCPLSPITAPVPVPTVSKACDDEKTRCTFTCEGDTTGVDEVTYMWKSDDSAMEISSKELHIKKVMFIYTV